MGEIKNNKPLTKFQLIAIIKLHERFKYFTGIGYTRMDLVVFHNQCYPNKIVV